MLFLSYKNKCNELIENTMQSTKIKNNPCKISTY